VCAMLWLESPFDLRTRITFSGTSCDADPIPIPDGVRHPSGKLRRDQTNSPGCFAHATGRNRRTANQLLEMSRKASGDKATVRKRSRVHLLHLAPRGDDRGRRTLHALSYLQLRCWPKMSARCLAVALASQADAA
jgi:hypothetical protein